MLALSERVGILTVKDKTDIYIFCYVNTVRHY